MCQEREAKIEIGGSVARPAVRSKRRFQVSVAAAAGALWSAAPALGQQAQVLADGKEDYELHCAACHGPAGEGDGSMAEILIVPPPDLTAIAAGNDGVFPFWEVYAVIDGVDPIKGHETFQMPLGRDRFRRDEDKPGYLPAHVRVLQLSHFLQSIQRD